MVNVRIPVTSTVNGTASLFLVHPFSSYSRLPSPKMARVIFTPWEALAYTVTFPSKVLYCPFRFTEIQPFSEAFRYGLERWTLPRLSLVFSTSASELSAHSRSHSAVPSAASSAETAFTSTTNPVVISAAASFQVPSWYMVMRNSLSSALSG